MVTSLGSSVLRVEDHRFLVGAGRFVDDIVLPRQCFGVALLSTHAHALIRRIDVSRAARSDGVLCALTAEDAYADDLGGLPPSFMPEDIGGPKGYRTFRPLLVLDRVRCVGDRVAFVVAETEAQARHAIEMIDVEYESLPAAVGVETAIRVNASLIYDDCPENIACTATIGSKQAVDEAFAGAHCIVSLKWEGSRLSANPIEPRGAVGDYDAEEDRYTLYSSSQNPHGVRKVLAEHVFRLPERKFRVVSPDVGGGFGMKGDPYPEDGLVLWASRRCGRPVKWIASRSDSLTGDNHGRDQVMYGELAVDVKGRILGVRTRFLYAFGAYIAGSAIAPFLFSVRFVPGPYNVGAFYAVSQGIFTNTSPTAPYRGGGKSAGAYLIERLIDRAAAELDIDRVDIRRLNLISRSQMPYETPSGLVYDSGDFGAMLDRCLVLADWQGFAARKVVSRASGKMRGRAIAVFVEQGGVFADSMEIRLDEKGVLSILAGTHSHGQGHATVFSQLVSDWLGVSVDSIRYIQGDTDQVASGHGTYAGRSSMIGACALRIAVDSLIDKAKRIAGYMLEASPADIEFGAGTLAVSGTDRALTIVDVAKALAARADLPAEFGSGLSGAGRWAADPPNYPSGCHACEVEVDPDTGETSIENYVAVDDVGRALNPMICEGQLQGGIAQGIGQALMEQIAYEPASGQLLSGSFSDYAMPRAEDIPPMRVSLFEESSTTNPLGIKAVGEAGPVGAPPTVVNAILDALRPIGIDDIVMPATPQSVWRAIRASGGQTS